MKAEWQDKQTNYRETSRQTHKLRDRQITRQEQSMIQSDNNDFFFKKSFLIEVIGGCVNPQRLESINFEPMPFCL